MFKCLARSLNPAFMATTEIIDLTGSDDEDTATTCASSLRPRSPSVPSLATLLASSSQVSLSAHGLFPGNYVPPHSTEYVFGASMNRRRTPRTTSRVRSLQNAGHGNRRKHRAPQLLGGFDQPLTHERAAKRQCTQRCSPTSNIWVAKPLRDRKDSNAVFKEGQIPPIVIDLEVYEDLTSAGSGSGELQRGSGSEKELEQEWTDRELRRNVGHYVHRALELHEGKLDCDTQKYIKEKVCRRCDYALT